MIKSNIESMERAERVMRYIVSVIAAVLFLALLGCVTTVLCLWLGTIAGIVLAWPVTAVIVWLWVYSGPKGRARLQREVSGK